MAPADYDTLTGVQRKLENRQVSLANAVYTLQAGMGYGRDIGLIPQLTAARIGPGPLPRTGHDHRRGRHCAQLGGPPHAASDVPYSY